MSYKLCQSACAGSIPVRCLFPNVFFITANKGYKCQCLFIKTYSKYVINFSSGLNMLRIKLKETVDRAKKLIIRNLQIFHFSFVIKFLLNIMFLSKQLKPYCTGQMVNLSVSQAVPVRTGWFDSH